MKCYEDNIPQSVEQDKKKRRQLVLSSGGYEPKMQYICPEEKDTTLTIHHFSQIVILN